jgi:C-terminal processing protease CtpA/Prc
MNEPSFRQMKFFIVVLWATVAGISPVQAGDKKYVTLTNSQVQEMLKTLQADIKENYYDPAMHGLDLDQRFEVARQKIASAKSQDEALLDTAGALAALNDSHTSFYPPQRPFTIERGWRMQAIGDTNCYVTAVLPDSDAAAKGMKAGDQVVSVNGVPLVRQDIHNVEYAYSVFPQSGFHVVVRSSDGVERSLVTMAKVIPGQFMVRGVDLRTWERSRFDRRTDGPDKNRSRFYKLSKQALLWKLVDFKIQPAELNDSLDKIRSYEAIVIDLRGNPGGREDAVERMIGEFFDHDVRVGDRRTRKQTTPFVAKTRGHKAFGGKVIVLVDSKSSSAAEIFARVIQLENRGVVLGDRSAGAVMEAKIFFHAIPLDRSNVAQYAAAITVADLIMTDGKSLEKFGVIPDERILPTPADMAAGRDPVIVRAAELAGVKVTPDEAGKVFPFDWAQERPQEID